MFDDDPRWGGGRDRDHDPRDVNARDREPVDPRDVFMHDLDLPRSDERERVHDREREYRLRDSETRTLSTVGAFRVVSSRDLRDHDGRRTDPPSGDLRSRREQGLIRTVEIPGRKDVAVVVTDRGRSLLESHRRDHDPESRQEFYGELKKPREMEHDAQIYGDYLREAAPPGAWRAHRTRRLRAEARVPGVAARTRPGRADSDGRPIRLTTTHHRCRAAAGA